MSKVLIFTATYNESGNINQLITKIHKYYSQGDILIVDDNSPDGTQNIIKKFKKIKLIVRSKKEGLDTAHKLAFRYAKLNKYNYLITMDADLSHEPKELPKIVKLLKKNPFVIGSRYMKGGNCNMPLPRLILSVLGNKFIKCILRIKCDEFTTSYRGFNLDKLTKFNFKNIKSKGYSFFMETVFLINKHYKIVEIPINFKNRKSGVSKIPKMEIFRTFKNVILLLLKS